MGLYLGLRNPGHYAAIRERLSNAKTPLALIVFVLLFLPIVVALLAGIVGMIAGAEGNAAPLALGIAFLLFMTAATLAGAWVTGTAILRASEGRALDVDSDGGEAP